MTYRSVVNAMKALGVNPDEVAAGRSITGGERFKQVGGTYYVREASDEERDLIIEMMDDAIDRRGKPHLTPKDKGIWSPARRRSCCPEEHINLSAFLTGCDGRRTGHQGFYGGDRRCLRPFP